MKISFVGLSHLSLCYSAAALSKGFETIIFDEQEIIDNYKKNKLKIDEPNLEKIQTKYKRNFDFNSDFQLLNQSSIIFLAVDIVTDKKNNVIYERINNLLKKINKNINKKLPLIIMSQVEVGFTRKIQWPNNFKYHYVETLIFGDAINRALFPERVIIGKYKKNTKVNNNLLKFLKKFNCPILEFSFEESEFTKAMINIYLASQVTTTNFLNNIIKNFKNVSWNNIKMALSLDKRIGKFSYLAPGLGISGGNIERDLQSLRNLLKKRNKDYSYIAEIQKYSNIFKGWILEKIPLSAKNVGILGLTYKENTLSQKNSPQKLLTQSLKKKNINFMIHDFKFDQLSSEKYIYKNLKDITKLCDVLVIFHNIPIYQTLTIPKHIKCVIDPFVVMKSKKNNSKVKIINL